MLNLEKITMEQTESMWHLLRNIVCCDTMEQISRQQEQARKLLHEIVDTIKI